VYVLGTERHDARRIDNQLRGRSGRQGDPGESRFYLSLEDTLMKRFGAERVRSFMQWADIPPNQPIEHRWISKSIAQAQERVEGYYFDIRKRVLEYDDVVDKQRRAIYKQRDDILDAEPGQLREKIHQMIAEAIGELCAVYLEGESKDWDLEELYRQALTIYPVPADITPAALEAQPGAEDIEVLLVKGALQAYERKMAELGGPETMAEVERQVTLQAMDSLWVRHLTDLDVLREGIGLQAIRQRDPLVEYKIEGFRMWQELNEEIQSTIVRNIYRIELARQQEQRVANVREAQSVEETTTNAAKSAPEPVRASAKEKLGRNDPCWCGSGKKYKLCHYRQDQMERQPVAHGQVKQAPPTRRRH
jgi:preprotein translocase subunit SecA